MPKGKNFTQLQEGERIRVEVLLNQGLSLSGIARVLNRPTSTISREIKRNGPCRYRASAAQSLTAKRHRQKSKYTVFDPEMKEFIALQLRCKKWSPELISAAGRQLRPDFICAEWIYQWIWSTKFSQRKTDKKYQSLFKFLRHASRRRKRGRKRNMRGNIIGRVWIDKRPQVAQNRTRFGHMEADIVLGKDRQPGLLVVLDRRSRKTWLRKLPVKDTDYVMKQLSEICNEVGNVKTVTLDNDQSFAAHYRLNELGIKTFFTHPYSSQEKGSVENRIGIVRMFFPKKTNFKVVDQSQVQRVQNLINERPLRMFKYRCPNEIHIS